MIKFKNYENELINKDLSITEILKITENLKPYIIKTPLISNPNNISKALNTDISLKLEFLQHGGTFKARGALNNILNLSKEEKNKGVVAVSAGNHAIAVAYASTIAKVSSKVVMYKSSNIFRLNKAKSFNSEVIITNPYEGFEKMKKISKEEGRIIIHPFEGIKTMQGSATLGYEISEDIDHIDNIIVSVGGGGLIAGVGSIIRQKFPNCRIIGVEPEGARGITESLKKGIPVQSIKINTIADSLSPPFHLPQSFAVCQNVIDQMVLVSDLQMRKAMKFMSEQCKFILEPAGAAGIAALQGPLKNKLKNQKTVVVLCGSNIDMNSWIKLTSLNKNVN
jgi:threonine dehydratase